MLFIRRTSVFLHSEWWRSIRPKPWCMKPRKNKWMAYYHFESWDLFQVFLFCLCQLLRSVEKEGSFLHWTLFIYGWINRQFDVFQGIDIFAQTVSACNMICSLSLHGFTSKEQWKNTTYFVLFLSRLNSTGLKRTWNLLSSPNWINYLKNINFHSHKRPQDIFSCLT